MEQQQQGSNRINSIVLIIAIVDARTQPTAIVNHVTVSATAAPPAIRIDGMHQGAAAALAATSAAPAATATDTFAALTAIIANGWVCLSFPI